MKYITTREAAQICDVSKITIQTLVKAGVFNYKMSGKMYKISEEDIRAYADKIRDIHKATASIDEYLENVNATIERIDKEREEAEEALADIGLYPARVNAIKTLLYEFLKMYDVYFSYGERETIDYFLKGHFFSSIAEEKGVTRQCAHSLYNRAVRKILSIKRRDQELMERIEMLERENGMLRRELIAERKGVEAGSIELREDVAKLLNEKISDMSVSVRLQNVCKISNIVTIADLATQNHHELLQYRMFGKKTSEEARKLLEEHNLHFGMSLDDVITNIR